MRMKLLILSVVVLISFGTVTAQTGSVRVSKVGTTAATFLEIGIGAKANGMGGAFVSLSNDATALYWNPAGAAHLMQNEAQVVHTNWIADTKLDYAALVLPFGELGTLGFSYTSLNMPDMKVRTVEMPEGTGEYFSAGDLALGVSYARTLTDRFSIGFNAKYIQESIWHMTASAFAVDFGTLFRTDLFGGMVIGASISNFGTKMKLAGRDTRTFERVDPAKLGSNDQVPYIIDLNSWDLPLLFRIGVSTSPIKTEDFKWTVAVDALHPSDNYESVNAGTEISYQGFLSIRGGYQSLFLKDHEGGLSLGIGLNSKTLFSNNIVTFNYSYRDFGKLKSTQMFSLGITF